MQNGETGMWLIVKVAKMTSRSHKGQCLRLKSSMPFKRDLALQNIPLSKQPFTTQPQIAKWRRRLKSSVWYARYKNQQA